MQLSAFDGALTTNSTVTITVSANNNLTTGWILSPAASAAISGQVPITLISGITLVSGTLTYFPANNPQAVVTVNANTTGSGQIATLDATLLNNGGYFILLNGTNSQNVTQTSQVYVTAVGDYKPGRVTATITDLTVPAPGLPIQIQRTYDSLVRGTSSDFGYGWRLGINIQTQVSPTGDVTLTINGKTRTFYFTPPNNGLFTYWYTPQYTPEPGLYGSLSNTGDNCSGVLLHVGNVWECAISNEGQIYQPTGYQYTDPYGRIYTLASDGTLQSVQDLNNNTLTITPTGITSSNGLNVPFVRDIQGRITQITDTLGNQYQYGCDANGNLASVTYPSIATPAQYQYDSTHLLTQETDQRGNIAGSSTYYPNGTLQAVTDAVGNTMQYSYNTATNTTTVTNLDGGTVVTVADSYGSPLTITDPLGRTTTNTYDANHCLLTTTDPLSKTTTYTYDSNGFRTSVTDPLGNVNSATYNSAGGPTSIINPLNQTQNVVYDSNFNISSITDSIGQVAAFTYNSQALPLTAVDARGNTTNYTYDQYGNRLTATDPLHRTTTSTYDMQGNLASQTDPRGNRTQYAYDALNRKISTTDATSNVTNYAYDGNNNKISETDALSHTTSYTYDAANRQTQITYPDSTTKSFTYDFRGNKLTETDQLGRVTKYVYDLAGQLSSMTVAYGTSDAATTSNTYDVDGRKLTQIDPRDSTTSYAYDAAGRQTSLTDAIGNVTSYVYDAKGQRISLTDAKQRITTYTYDARGRQLTTTTPDTKTVTKTYDGLGNLLTTTDEENRTTSYVYDAANQLTIVTDALNEITEYGYDLSGNKTSQVDANNHTTTYVYDALNRRTSRTLPASQTESYTYDAVGNKATRTDFNGKVTSFAYDSLDRLLSRTPDASFSASPITFTYTSTGQRATMADPTGSTTYSYTNRDQVLSKATPQGTLSYTYDLSGNVASVVSSNANGTSVAYAWDADNRLSSVTDNRTSGVTTYNYDQTSQLSTLQYPNGVAHAFTYDNRDRPTILNVTGPLGVSLSYAQTFSPSGRKTNVTDQTGRETNYGYSSVYRLLSENIADDPTSTNNGALTYLLDPVGNRLSLTSTLAALSNQTNTFDADDRLASDTYDANGNTLTSSGHNLAYDFEDRLTQSDASVQMAYDGDGNRIVRTQGGSTTRYLVDDLTPTRYPQVAEEVVSGAVVAQFTYGSSRISQNRAGVPSYYGYDGHGSVRQLFSGAGAVTDTYQYDAFGGLISRTGSTMNSYMFAGEQYDVDLNLYYMRARWYNQRMGRFLTQDTVQGLEMMPSTLSLYPYGLGDPVGNVDPSGNAVAIEAGLTDDKAILKYLIFAGTLTGVGLGCKLECGDNRGRWQAQGSDMEDAGAGAVQTWNLLLPPWKVMGLLQLTALMSTLSPKQVANRLDAYKKAVQWLVNLRGGASAGDRRNFPALGNGIRRYWDRQPNGKRRCPNGDCRIDVEVTAGRAFIF